MKPSALLFSLALSLTACAVPTGVVERAETVAPGTQFTITGATFRAPNEYGWMSHGVSRANVYMRRFGETQGETIVALAVTYTARGDLSDTDFLKFTEVLRSNGNNRPRFSEVRYSSEPAELMGASCVKTSFHAKDNESRFAGASGFQYLETIGYICRHPRKKSLAVVMEFSRRANDPTMSRPLLRVAGRFFGSLKWK